jgi:molybdopterin/thiamine biosynthesis adenylyltransferase
MLAPDIRQWSAAYGRHAGPLVAGRARATVRIHGLDRAGQELARLLASAGTGTLQLCDPQPVGLGDLSTGLLKVPDLGRPRTGACAIHLRRLAPHLRVQEIRAQQVRGREWTRRPPSPEPEPDVAVVFARERVPAEIQAGFASAQAPHLRVLFGDAGASVGPLVLPGSTACLDCAPDAQDPQDPSPQPPSEPETALAAAVAGLAAVQVLMLLDGINVPAAVDGILHLDLATGGIVREAIAPRPGCLCRALAA